jgi:hypothetical protein
MFSLCLAVCLATIPRDGTTFDQHSKSTRNLPGHSSCADSFSAYWGLTIDLLSFDFRVSLRSQSRFRAEVRHEDIVCVLQNLAVQDLD